MVNGADAEVNEMNKTINNRTASLSNLFSFLLSIDVSLLSWKDVKQETRLLLKRRGITKYSARDHLRYCGNLLQVYKPQPQD